jgi:hypothetical protein
MKLAELTRILAVIVAAEGLPQDELTDVMMATIEPAINAAMRDAWAAAKEE